MLETFKNDDDRGQVGIGTLIVFIAMVLVAAIAAGVLINTAGFLQSGAEETGQQSSDQVTNRLQEVSSVGAVTDGNISSVNITVKKAPGANNIDLSTTTLQFVHSSGSTDMTYETSTSATNFTVSAIQDEGGESIVDGSPVLNDPADRARITLNTTAIIGSGGLGEGDTATIQLNTQSGGTTEIRLVVPETLSGADAVTL
ncbi:archaellin/type IV pilin N-terminal domain-containing protein [Haloarcula salinisoli]|uniref:Flagellin n=1 Tax=Haloarcula salinisoli TaxID=2487746 RepID=A0A8J7YFC2_9EURY|nr:archaellin/type IV pilin N-terminal domain-containing protein [Halomicroarcula salinisoli]MBX0304417.1 flagellin [Halomicroarcula salinisoli]